MIRPASGARRRRAALRARLVPARRPRRGSAPAPPGRPARPAEAAGRPVESDANAPSSTAITRSRWATRSALVASPSASGSSPKPAHSRRHSPSLPTLSCTAPSAQWNSPYGQIDGWWLPWRARHLAGHRVAGPLERVHPDDRREQARPDHLPATGPLPLEQGGEDAVGAVHPGEQVPDRNPDPLRIVRPRAGQRHQAALALGDLVVPGPASLRTIAPEPRDGQHNEPRVELREPDVAESQPVHHPGPEVLQEHVGPLDQPREQLPSLVGAQVGRHGLLVPVAREEVRGLPRPAGRIDERRTPPATVVTAVRGLDFDHPGAEVAEHHGGVRAGQGAGEVDDDEPGERAFGGVGRSLRHGA